jgi:serine/threonine protein kinase
MKLNHWMWQGLVDVLAALKFFHFPGGNHISEIPGQLILAHFQMRPASILVDEMGTFIITDFGQARIKGLRPKEGTSLTAQTGDLNYQPPPLLPLQYVGPGMDEGPRWSHAYDVWSMACIMAEVIVYITQNGSIGLEAFQARRHQEDPSDPAFWIFNRNEDRFELRQSVQQTLNGFRRYQDPYLNTIISLLEAMFSIDPMQRPTMAACFEAVSQDVSTNEWPLIDEDELSICGLGTNPQLRNM